MSNLYKIRNKQGQLITFHPNDIQLRHIIEREGHRYNRILKARQFGITTFYSIDELDEALWTPGITCAIIAHEAQKLEGYFSIVKIAFENLPNELKPLTKTDTKRKYDFLQMYNGTPLNSSIYVDTDIRGGTVQSLHITEIAYIKNLAKLAAGSKQAVPKGGRISEETTANGFNQFYDDFMMSWNNQEPKEFDYRAYFYPWFLHDEYQLPTEIKVDDYDEYEKWLLGYAKEKYNFDITPQQIQWRRWKKADLINQLGASGLSGDQLFKQEYPATIDEAFQSGAGNVFDGEKIDAIEPLEPIKYEDGIKSINEMTVGEEYRADLLVKYRRMDYREVRFWKLPEAGRKYVVGVDPSDGEGADFGSISVWDQEKYEKVAEYYGKLRPDELAELAVDICIFFNRAYLGIENNMLTTILFASKIYDNYYFEVKVDEKTLKKTKKLGWNTNSRTRDLMIDDFMILFDEGSLIINSRRTLGEMRTFVKKDNGKREHADGKYDDMLFADFIAIQMIRRKPKAGRIFTHRVVGL